MQYHQIKFISFKSGYVGDIGGMRAYYGRLFYLGGVLLVCVLVGCRHKESTAAGDIDLVPESKLGTRIGSVAMVATPGPIAVEGFGLVGNLARTGSADCPQAVRDYLKRYFLAQSPAGGYDIDKLIDSKDTAVVHLRAVLPAAAMKNEHFDVQVSLLAGSEATSLHGGWLYKAELMPAGTLGAAARMLATVEGPVFIDMIGVSKPDLREGYILGGGRATGDYRGLVSLRKTDYLLASGIRNRLNDRYGPGTAEALSPTAVGLRIPAEYRRRRLRFISLVRATYLDQTRELIDARTNTLVRRLAVSDKKEDSEIALEALGRESLTKLADLLNASDEEVRLRATRCMLYLDDDRGFGTLREIALDAKSQLRLEAFDALSLRAQRNDASALAQRLLRDKDSAVVLAAYEHLREMNDPTILQERIARSFYIEQVAGTDRKAIYVTRSGDPRIVLFGAPLTCRKDVFVQSPDGMVMVNTRPGQEFVSLIRRHPTQPGLIGPLNTGFDLADIIRTLGGESGRTKDAGPAGLDVSYSDVIVLLQQLATKDMAAAEFWAGPLSKLGLIIKK